MRITFPTPQPFYPYREPELDHAAPPSRLLAVWYLGDAPMVPVAHAVGQRSSRWERPWRRGVIEGSEPAVHARQIERSELPEEIAALAPQGSLSLQAFQDQRTERRGLGDVLFVPERPEVLSAADAKQREHLLPLLDPALVPAPVRPAKEEQ